MRKRIIWCLIGLASSLTFVLPEFHISSGSNPWSATLRNKSDAVRWSGSLARSDAPAGEIPECASTGCDRFDLEVSLPGGVWNNKPGGLEVSVRWPLIGFADNLKLYIYRGGALVARSEGIISSAQSVLIPQAANGPYQVYVAFDQDSSAASIPYEALAEVEYQPKPNPARQLLPDLVTRPQRNVTFQTPELDFFEPPPAPGETCYPSEAAEEGAETCLRFDQVFANVGEGTMELRFAVPRDGASHPHDIFQRIYRSTGGFDERVGGDLEFHPIHQHYHYTGFGITRLYASNAAGRRLGSSPVRARRMKKIKNRQPPEPVRAGRKVSFCLADTELDFWLKKGNGPRTYNAPDCLFPAYSDAEHDYFVQGITAGWGDVYDWYLPDQYIEVTGVPDGYYILETTADPDDTLLEADESNNCGAVLIRLSGMGTATPSAEVIRPLPSC